MNTHLSVGSSFLTEEVANACKTDMASTAGFLSRLRKLGVLTVISKRGHKYIWEVVELKEVVIGYTHTVTTPAQRTGKVHRHKVLTYADLGITPPTAPLRRHFLGSTTPPPTAEIETSIATLLSGLSNLGKELSKFQREVLAATPTIQLLGELARREKLHRGDHH